MKKQASLLLSVLFLVIPSISTAGIYSGGSGTEGDPYLIATPQDMNAIGADSDDWSKCFKLAADINMACYIGSQYKIIGDRSTQFTGSFDGDGHIIRNLNYNYTTTSTSWFGLFGYTSYATIKDLGLEDVNICVKGGLVGALTGEQRYGLISNCYASGKIINIGANQNVWVGGLIGCQRYGTSLNCYSLCDIQNSASYGNSYTGGFSGSQYQGIIKNCYSTGSVSSISTATYFSYCGGFVGTQDNYSDCKIESCYSTGRVYTEGDYFYSGGFIGQYGGIGIITGCFWDTDTNGMDIGIGSGSSSGVVGMTTSEMKKLKTFTDADWDFKDVWNIGEGQTYPYLRKYETGDLNFDKIVNMLDFAIFTEDWLVEQR